MVPHPTQVGLQKTPHLLKKKNPSHMLLINSMNLEPCILEPLFNLPLLDLNWAGVNNQDRPRMGPTRDATFENLEGS